MSEESTESDVESSRIQFRENVLASVLLTIIIVLAFIPAAPLGGFSNSMHYGDAIINNTLIIWIADTWWHDPFGVFDIPIFHPQTEALANMDPVFLPAIVVTPLWLLTGSAPFVYNSVMLLAALSAGFAFYFCIRNMMKVHWSAALTGSIFFAINTDRFWHSAGHMNQVWTFVVPLSFWAGWRIIQKPDWKSALFVAISGLLALWCSFYLLIFAFFAGLSGVLISLFICDERDWKKMGLWISVSAIAGIVLIMPTVSVYAGKTSTIRSGRGSLFEAASNSASIDGWFLPPNQEGRLETIGTSLTGQEFQTSGMEDEQFLGWLMILILVGAGCFLIYQIVRSVLQKQWPSNEILLLFLCLLAGSIFLLFSLGPYVRSGIRTPYYLLHVIFLEHLRFFRCPARFAVLVQFFFSAAAVLFLSQLILLLKDSKKFFALPTIAFIVILHAVEHFPVTFTPRFQWSSDPVLEVLKEQQNDAPFVSIPDPANLRDMLALSDSWRPTLNGWPTAPLVPDYEDYISALEEFPTTRSIAILNDANVRYVVYRGDTSDDIEGLKTLFQNDYSVLYELENSDTSFENYSTEVIEKITSQRIGTESGILLADFAEEDTVLGRIRTALEDIEGEGLKLTHLHPDDIQISTMVEKFDPAYVDQIIIEISSERSFNGTHMILHMTDSALENESIVWRRGNIQPAEGDDHNFVAVFDVSSHPGWYELPELDRFRMDFRAIGFDSLTPVFIRRIRAVQFSEPRIYEPPVFE